MDEDLCHLAALGHVVENDAGGVCVDVDLEVRVGAHHELAVSQAAEELEGLRDVDVVALEEELGAVHVVGAGPVVDLLDGDLGLRARELGGVGQLAGVSGDGGDKGPDEDGQAKAAGVDDAVLLEDGQELRGALDGCQRLVCDGAQGVVDGGAGLRGGHGGGAGVLEHREDGALDGLAHSLEGHGNRALHGGGDGVCVDFLNALEALAQAAQDLAGDDAGVAAGAHERAMGHGLAQGLGVCAHGERLDLLGHGLHGERHVGAGVSVRDGEDVEAVDLLLALGERGGSRCDANAKFGDVHVLLVPCLDDRGRA